MKLTTFTLDIYLELLQGICLADQFGIAPYGLACINGDYVPITAIHQILYN